MEAKIFSGVARSPKMKYLINAPNRMTMESCPRRNAWVNDTLLVYSASLFDRGHLMLLTRTAVGRSGVHLDHRECLVRTFKDAGQLTLKRCHATSDDTVYNI